MSPPRNKPTVHEDPGPEQAESTEPAPPPPAEPPAAVPAADLAAPEFPNPDSGQIGLGATGDLPDYPECPVCYAHGGGGHGSQCPNAGKDPADWVTEPQAGWARPARGT
jgi:hypothetical protein